MLKILEENKKLLSEATYLSMLPINKFTSWKIVLEPSKILAANRKTDFKSISIIFEQCIYIGFKGFEYPAYGLIYGSKKPPTIQATIMDVIEVENSILLKEYFRDKSDRAGYGAPPYSPLPQYSMLIDRFHHINLSSQEIDIDVICVNVKITRE